MYYEVGYAHAKSKLCILLTKDASTIPFDLKGRRHIVYSSIEELKRKLARELKALQGEMKLSFNPNSPGCIEEVPVFVYSQRIGGQSQATSVRIKVETNAQVPLQNVTGFLSKIEKRKADGAWEELKTTRDIQLWWVGDTIATELSASKPKLLNVVHIDHNANLITIWQSSMPPSLVNFFKDMTTYRLTVSVVAQGGTRQIRLELDWEGRWDTMVVRLAEL